MAPNGTPPAGGPGAGEEVSVEEAYARFAGRTRTRVLREFADAWTTAGFELDDSLTVPDLVDAIDGVGADAVADAVEELEGYLLRRHGDGYRLRYVGWRLARLLQKSPLVDHTAEEPFEFDSRCHFCEGTRLSGRFENQWLWIDCADCGGHVNTVERPPVETDGMELAEFLAAASRRQHRRERHMADGVCPECFADVEYDVTEFTWGETSFTRLQHRCHDCGRAYQPPLAWYVLDGADVRSFYRRHGVDLDDRYLWETGPLVHHDYERVVAEEPWRFEVRFPCGDEELAVEMDAEKSVVAVEERDRRGR